nr:GNAT family N-acetyltransferase [Cellulosimicrobium arenosum]
MRPATARTVAGAIEHAIVRPGTTVLLAEIDGRPVGVVGVDHPGIASEASRALAYDHVAYVVVLHVDARARGRGVGRALVDAALEAVRPDLGRDGGSTAASALHHGVLNPLSSPFWARAGFRPALTSWERPTALPWAPVSAAHPRLVP